MFTLRVIYQKRAMDYENMPLFYFEEQILLLSINGLKTLCMDLKQYTFEKYNVWSSLLSRKQLDEVSMLFALEVLQRRLDSSNRVQLCIMAVGIFKAFKAQEKFFIDSIKG